MGEIPIQFLYKPLVIIIPCEFFFAIHNITPAYALPIPLCEVILMKFIISTFSPAMFIDTDFDLRWHKLSEDEFQALAYDAYSCVGYEDVAKLINVAYNREPVKARVGDILLLAQMSNGNLEFYCIQVCQSEFPLVRADEYMIDEEMI